MDDIITEAVESGVMPSARELADQRTAVVCLLKADPELRLFVNDKLSMPEPFIGQGPIRLIMLGQDPTVEREASREAVKTVLNLNRPGPPQHHSRIHGAARRRGRVAARGAGAADREGGLSPFLKLIADLP
jgi:hypothetical protein